MEWPRIVTISISFIKEKSFRSTHKLKGILYSFARSIFSARTVDFSTNSGYHRSEKEGFEDSFAIFFPRNPHEIGLPVSRFQKYSKSIQNQERSK